MKKVRKYWFFIVRFSHHFTVRYWLCRVSFSEIMTSSPSYTPPLKRRKFNSRFVVVQFAHVTYDVPLFNLCTWIPSWISTWSKFYSVCDLAIGNLKLFSKAKSFLIVCDVGRIALVCWGPKCNNCHKYNNIWS